MFNKPDTIVVVESKLTKIDQFRQVIKTKFGVKPKLQRLFYGGKLLENGYTFHDYNIKLNDVIQLMVKAQPDDIPVEEKQPKDTKETAKEETEKLDEVTNTEDKVYKDAVSTLYAIGDLVDVRHCTIGAWFEGKIARIVYDPTVPNIPESMNTSSDKDVLTNFDSNDQGNDKENDARNCELNASTSNATKTRSKGITRYFSKSPKTKSANKSQEHTDLEALLLYKVEIDADEEEGSGYYTSKNIRPRARKEIDIKLLKVGQTVMVNYNTSEPQERGYWYDLKVTEIKKLKKNHVLIGTIYLGPEAVPQNDTTVTVLDKIFAIEKVVPVIERTATYKALMTTPPENRSQPLLCLTCRDEENVPCKDCGCNLCSGKEAPEKIILCDECNYGYHMSCLDPPLTKVPDEDWYCPSCKRDPNDVIAPGAAKQTKKISKTKRDWGRGMACVGKTKTCAMPSNHFGPIPGIEVGMCWRFRIQLSESGVHRPPVSGIHGRDNEGAYSIVLSGGYEDDVDYGNEFTYTGSGGRDLSGNKRTAVQSCDQTLTRENRALARNCAVEKISEDGGDAGENWQKGKPVRVVRSYKMLKHFPKYAPKEGIRYDGIYKVVKYYPEEGLSGYRVWKYLLRRDDPSPAPWESGAKEYSIVYPDGYLEAEAEKKALKNGKRKSEKRALNESNHNSDSESENQVPVKKAKTDIKATPKNKIANAFSKGRDKKKLADNKLVTSSLSAEEKEAIQADTLNSKLWDECCEVCETKGRQEFVESVMQGFLCIICQDVAVTPVTTPCLHNFCMACLTLAYKSTGRFCPCCRQSLEKYEMKPNEQLKTALRTIMAGYDAGKK